VGHGKAESLAALFVSLILCGVAIIIGKESINKIIVPDDVPPFYTLIVLVGVVLAKELLFRFLTKKSKDLDSLALEADAWHSRSDALTSLAAFIGISISVLGGERFASADDWAALFASGIILFNGIRILKSATGELMDSIPEPDVEIRVREIAQKVQGVTDVEKCRIRRSGSGFLLELHIEVDGNISVAQGHAKAHEVKDALINSGIGIIDAAIHVEPSQG
jgi:cation diffusion facilitator family transporter